MRTPCSAPLIEALETRIAPAAIVTVTFTAGALTLAGDGGDHDFSITALDASTIELKAAAGTLFHMGTAADTDTLRLATPLKSLDVTLGDGVDHLSLVGLTVAGDAKIAGGLGANTIATDSVTIKGGLKVTGGTGADTLTIAGSIFSVKKDFILELGDGANAVTTTAPNFVIGGKLSYTGGTGADSFTASESVSVKKDLSFTLGAGAASITADTTANFSVGGKMSVDSSGSLAGDVVKIEPFAYGGVIKGDLQVIDGAGNLNLSQTGFGINNLSGKVTIVTGAGTSNVVLGSELIFFGLGLSSKTKTVLIDARDSSSSSFGMAIGKGLSGGVKYLGGSGGDRVQIYSTSQAATSSQVDVDLGDGANYFNALCSAGGFKKVKVNSGSGTNEVQLSLLNATAGNFDIHNGGGNSTTILALLNSVVTGKISVTSDAGGGTSELSIGCANSKLGSLDFVSATATSKLNFGGSTNFGGTAIHSLNITKQLRFVAAGGNDSVDFTGAANIAVGSMDLNLGDGDNTVTGGPATFAIKSFAITGGTGKDTISLSGNGSLGKTTLALGAGINSATLSGTALPLAMVSLDFTSTSTTGQADSLTLARVLVAGKLNAKFGADVSTLQIDDSVIGGTFDVATGAGADLVKLDTATTNTGTILVKAATLKLGEGADSLILGGNSTSALLTTKSTFTADGEAGMNTLTNPASNIFAKAPVFQNLTVI